MTVRLSIRLFWGPVDGSRHEDSGQINLGGVGRSGGHRLFDLDGHLPRHRRHRIEVQRQLVEEVARCIPLDSVDQGEFAGDSVLENARPIGESARLLRR